jgi:hypothetical protein
LPSLPCWAALSTEPTCLSCRRNAAPPAGSSLSRGNLAAIRATLEAAGVIFITRTARGLASGSEKSTGFATLASVADGGRMRQNVCDNCTKEIEEEK